MCVGTTALKTMVSYPCRWVHFAPPGFRPACSSARYQGNRSVVPQYQWLGVWQRTTYNRTIFGMVDILTYCCLFLNHFDRTGYSLVDGAVDVVDGAQSHARL